MRIRAKDADNRGEDRKERERKLDRMEKGTSRGRLFMFINVPYVRLSIRRFTLVPREIMILTYASCRVAEGLSGLTTLRIAETTIASLDTLTEYIIVNVADCVIVLRRWTTVRQSNV